MNITALIGVAAAMPPELVGALGALAAFLVVLAAGVQLAARNMQRELDHAEEDLVDRATGLLPRSALRVRLGAELAWASSSRTPVAVAVLRIRGSRFTHASHVLRHAMREEEGAFLLGDQHVAVELWGADADAAVVATRRLGEGLERAGHPVVDVGLACAPRDGSDVETLVGAARRDLRPIDDPRDPGTDIGRDGRARTAGPQAAMLLLRVLPWFAAMGMLLLLTWRLVPAAIEPLLTGDGERTAIELLYAIIATIGLPVGAALLHASAWNVGNGAAPRSRPLERAGTHTSAIIAIAIAVPLAWGVFAPLKPEQFADGFGATLAVVGLVVLALVHARLFVHLPYQLLAALVVIGGVVTWLGVEFEPLSIIANAGRLLLAVALGALLAKLVERASWIVLLALIAGGVDLWSVYADQGVTGQLLDAEDQRASRIVELLLFTGPSIDGVPLFQIGATDLVFLALFLCWSHDWRLDLRVAAGALFAATWIGALTAELLAEPVPLLPFLAAAMVLVVGRRSLLLRRRVSASRRSLDGAAATAR